MVFRAKIELLTRQLGDLPLTAVNLTMRFALPLPWPVWPPPESGQSGLMANGSQNQSPGLIKSRTMSLTAEQADAIKNELKRFAGDLNLSDEQKTKLHERLASAAEKLHEYKKSHPNVTREDIIKAVVSHKAELRAGLERFLTPEQLKKWDAEVAKGKEFLGFAAA